MSENHLKHNIAESTPLSEAFRRLNEFSGSNMTLFAVDAEGRLVGSLTDGDLRRAIIAGMPLDAPVAQACRRDCMTAPASGPLYETVAKARRRGIALVPVVDDQRRIVRLLDLRRLKSALPIDAVLMAGGRGERLRPLTDTVPKPLLPVGGRPIIDHNVDELMACGVERIFVTVNYLKEQLMEHFADPRFEGRVQCVEEPCRLGTMGSLALCRPLTQETVLVMNSDLLTTVSFEKMWLAHMASGAALTMAAVPYTVSVPFAIIEAKGRRITGLAEKPTFSYFANAGIYMMRREIAEGIPQGEYLDAPDLVTSLIEHGLRTEYFPIDGTWLDIGSPEDYRAAQNI